MTEIETARAAVAAETFGTEAWEAAMATVRALVAADDAGKDLRPLNVRLVKKGRGYRTIRA